MKRKKCACGCGEILPIFNKRGEISQFKHGHNTKKNIPWDNLNKGKKFKKGKDHRYWKGGRIRVHDYVYIYKPDHHFSNSGGYVPEHRLVWEEYYNSCLLKNADVHHKNNIRYDNRIENLEAMTHSQHMKLQHIYSYLRSPE